LVPRTVLVNPVITPLPPPGEARELGQAVALPHSAPALVMLEDWEGCLSVPGLRGKVPRFSRIRYQGFDQFGDTIDRVVEGFHARVVQHECDHLIGKLYPMRLRDFSQFGFTSVLFPGLGGPED
jgi:peptide deformylase